MAGRMGAGGSLYKKNVTVCRKPLLSHYYYDITIDQFRIEYRPEVAD